MNKKLYIFLLLCFTTSLYSQNWQLVGDSMVSDFGSGYPYITINKSNVPYIIYPDMSYGGVVVKKFNGFKWNYVGQKMGSGSSNDTKMDFDSAGTPYVIYLNSNSKPTVQKFNGSSWVIVGQAEFTPGTVSVANIKISPDNTPYVAFRDFSQNASATVMKFDGTNWINVGQPGFTPQKAYNGAWNISLAIDKTGTPWIAFIDMTNNWRVSVMKYNGVEWEYVGSPNISQGGADGTNLVFDSQNRPIVVYTNGSAQAKIFNGTNWVQLGQPSFANNPDFLSLVIDKNDCLYISYIFNKKINVKKFDGFNWLQAGNADFHTLANGSSVAVDENCNVYTAFMDATDRHISPTNPGAYHVATVMELKGNVITGLITAQHSLFSLKVFPNPTSEKVQINYNMVKESKGTIKITNLNGLLIYKEDFSGTFNKEINLGKYAKGIYLVEIKTPNATERKKIILE